MEVDFEMGIRDELFRDRMVVAAVCACILGAILLNTPGVDQRQAVSAFLLAGGLLFIGFVVRRKQLEKVKRMRSSGRTSR